MKPLITAIILFGFSTLIFGGEVDAQKTKQVWAKYAKQFSPLTSLPPKKTFKNREEGLKWMAQYSVDQSLAAKKQDLTGVDPAVIAHLDLFAKHSLELARFTLASIAQEQSVEDLAPNDKDLLKELSKNAQESNSIQENIDKNVADAVKLSLLRMKSLDTRKKIREQGTEVMREMLLAFSAQEKAVYRHLGVKIPQIIFDNEKHIRG